MKASKNNNISDEDLVKEIVETKDTLLFEVLYDRFATLVYNKCFGFAKDEDEAKDLTQDVFLKLFVKLGSFKGDSKFSTWLYAFTYNHCVNYVTRNNSKRIEKNSVNYSDVEPSIEEEDIEDESGFFQMKVENLKEALEIISPDEKMILVLKYQEKLSIKEIESILDIGESAVKMRIKRAKDRLISVYNDKYSNK